MKKTQLIYLSLLLMVITVGCKEQPDQLTISKEKMCLHYKQSEQCMDAAGTYRLHLAGGKPVLEALEVSKLAGTLTYPQYGRPDAIKTESLGVIIENKVLSLQDGDRKFMDSTGLGFLLIRDAAGAITLSAGISPELTSTIYDLDSGSTLANAGIGQVIFQTTMMTETMMALSVIKIADEDAATHLIPNDTGTEVVIIDNFKVVGNCGATAPVECCHFREPAGPAIPLTDDLVNSYTAQSRRLLACFPVNSICTFRDGDKLIVIVCATGKSYCLDASVCEIYLTTTDDNGTCISVPEGCKLQNPF